MSVLKAYNSTTQQWEPVTVKGETSGVQTASGTIDCSAGIEPNVSVSCGFKPDYVIVWANSAPTSPLGGSAQIVHNCRGCIWFTSDVIRGDTMFYAEGSFVEVAAAVEDTGFTVEYAARGNSSEALASGYLIAYQAVKLEATE